MWRNFLTLAFIPFAFDFVKAQQKCADGEDNVIRIEDASKGGGPIRFKDVRLLTYDARLKPVCAENEEQQSIGAIHLPGFIKISSGEINIAQSVDTKQPIWMDLTAEHNSFFIGQICDKGESQSAFVPNDACSYELCKFLGDDCNILEAVGTIELQKIRTQLIPLPPATFQQIEGEWKVHVSFRQNNKVLASARASDSKGLIGWHAVIVGDEEDEKDFLASSKSKSAVVNEEL